MKAEIRFYGEQDNSPQHWECRPIEATVPKYIYGASGFSWDEALEDLIAQLQEIEWCGQLEIEAKGIIIELTNKALNVS